MFVPDLLHEFELGVWKAIFTHLMRICYASGNDCIQNLNWRYVFAYHEGTKLIVIIVFIAIDKFHHLVEEQFDVSMKMRLQ